MATAIIKKTKNPTKNISTVYLTESFKSKDFDSFSKEELQYLDDLFNKKRLWNLMQELQQLILLLKRLGQIWHKLIRIMEILKQLNNYF